MIKLHHLNASRSIRILWLLEEIGQPYEIIKYQRDANSNLAPQSLKAIHPLGKSPVIELDNKVIAESGAIVELLIKRFAPELAPDQLSAEYSDYLQWIHFAESSAMLPFLLKVFNR
ncbi:MAG TPA: glutathione S-transferase, partial [Pseudomonas sp.]|nr:glutathione S-transferase [Pseudomonas sp.]